MNPPEPIPVGMEPPPMRNRTPTPSARPPDRGGKAKGPARSTAADRFEVLNAFIDVTMADLTRAELAVWLVLYRDTREGTARTPYDAIAGRAGLNRRNVSRALNGLKRRGLVQIIHRGGLRGGVSRYRVRGVGKGG